MKLTHTRYAITLAAAFAWSSTAFAMNCACEVPTGACAKCCGALNTGFKHCGIKGNGGPPPPAVLSVPKAMPVPAGGAADAAAAPPAPHATGDKAKSTGKSPMPDKTRGSTGKDGP